MRHKFSVGDTGALAGSLVRGVGRSNLGIRLQLFEDQSRSAIGTIQGQFVIVDVGDNQHSDNLRPLLKKVTNALEVVKIQRREGSSCINATVVQHLDCET